MISVVIPTLNAERSLPKSLAALVPAAIDGVVREVIVVDGGSSDNTRKIADAAGAEILISEAGRGRQLSKGAAAARFPWLLFLHADTVLRADWHDEAHRFIEAIESGAIDHSAAAFRFRLDDNGLRARALEALVKARCTAVRLPYGDQGLLISQTLYDEVGGFKMLPIMEDVDLVRRLGRRRVALLNSDAVTSAERYRREGYLKRALRNQTCLALYSAGLPVKMILRLYGAATPTR
jgi:rSAM/selenodomain-associated transferase 2